MEQEKKWGRREEDKWKMEGEWMRGDTHSDTERWKTCWERHLVITKREDSWHGPNPLSTQKIYLSLRLQTSLLSSFLSLYLQEKQGTTAKGREERGMERKGKTPLIYMPLRNRDCISLSCAIVYCVSLSIEKNGTEKEWAGCWAIKAALCVVACQHCRLFALTNLVTQTHSHTLTEAQRDSSSYTSNSGEAPNQTQKGQFTLGHTLVLIIKSWDYSWNK